MQYADFNGPGERSWKIQYQASLAFLAAPDWQFGAAYGRGQADLTRVDPDSAGYGYLYNPNGKNAQHWERDLSLRYAFPAGPAKGLSVTLRWPPTAPAKATPPRQHPRQLQLRRIPGGGRLPDQVALNPRNQKRETPSCAAALPTFGALSALCLEARADAVALRRWRSATPASWTASAVPACSSNCPCNTFGKQRQRRRRAFGSRSATGSWHHAVAALRLPSQNTLLGAHYGAEVLLPLVRLDLDIDGGPDGRRTRQGDLIVSPLMLQWGPLRCSVAPTGSA